MQRSERGSFRRQWVQPIVLLAAIALFAFALFYVLDHYATGVKTEEYRGGTARTFFNFSDDHITDAVSQLGAMMAAVLGMVITVVSIVVQLSAERYTGVTKMFFRDRTNLLVLAYYVIACVAGIWVSMSVHGEFVPRATLVAMMVTDSIGFVIMAPFFAHVFRFLEPANIIARIRRDASRTADLGMVSTDTEVRDALQAELLNGMEELTDITSNSISGKDKIIASRAVDALKDLAVGYARAKVTATPQWFVIGAAIRDNPDFVAMEPESLDDLEQRRTWVEWKVMRQYLGIFTEALQSMRDINYLIAIDTRYIGEAALVSKDSELLTLTSWFMNSYLRAALNAKDVRTAYNILNQYRLLVEAMLRAGDGAAAVTAVGHLKYYGDVSFNMNLPFVTETVAYDVCALIEIAHELQLAEEDTLLSAFLDLDRTGDERAQEQALKGVRKAQVKLAAYYLSVGESEKAQRIREDMEHEPRERLRAIRDELERVKSKDFWEIIDRGRNFEYMPAEQRARMREFFSFLPQQGEPTRTPPIGEA
ncbi:MAG: DUF2254 domain-containing protein [Labilithrix sp.]|nr:DUF2254 domain-containing protein [Labilithrix sp.]MCW5832092.1 DUF2254 domain-containing protein [Labilithrix sp.]